MDCGGIYWKRTLLSAGVLNFLSSFTSSSQEDILCDDPLHKNSGPAADQNSWDLDAVRVSRPVFEHIAWHAECDRQTDVHTDRGQRGSLRSPSRIFCWRGVAVTRWSRSTYSYSTLGPVSTWIGDRMRADKPSQYVASQLGLLSLLPSVGW